MKLLTYCFLTTFFFFSISAYAQSTSPSTPLVSENRTLSDFTTLDIQGPVNVYLDATHTSASLHILGDPKTVSNVTWQIKDHHLYLGTQSTYWPHRGDRLTIKVNTTPSQLNHINFHSQGSLFGKGLAGSLSINAKGKGCIHLYTNKLNLQSLYIEGKTTIAIHNIKSSHLNIQAHDTDHPIKLEGEAALNTVDFTGNGSLIIYWVNSPYLKINACGKGKIVLAGVASTLDAKLAQKIQLLAKQLRVHEGFIKTGDQTQAKVTISNRLYAFAKGQSAIYYTQPIRTIYAYTENTGLICSTTGS